MDLDVVTLAVLRDELEEGGSIAYKKMPTEISTDQIGVWTARCTTADGVQKMLVSGAKLHVRQFKSVAALYNFHVTIFGDAGVNISLPTGFDEFSVEHNMKGVGA